MVDLSKFTRFFELVGEIRLLAGEVDAAWGKPETQEFIDDLRLRLVKSGAPRLAQIVNEIGAASHVINTWGRE